MKKAKKVLLLVLCAALLVGASVAGTVAYLTSQDVVTNTFTVGKVEITLDEAKVDVYGVVDANATSRVQENTYKLVPGHTYVKDPIVHVSADSENCWLFVKIVNGSADAVINGLDTNGWTQIGTSNYWAYGTEAVAGGSNVPVFDSFTYKATVTDPSADDAKTIVVTAYAIQADGLTQAQAQAEVLKLG